ncbi:MAG TPA: adenine deaminase C-terminal domain-containing protein [Syntrophorhabdaceae bacterium]|nr:adenine deaminase C-terminal domain-containing protein [Syntrophorhabdaceae bacterium]
MSISDKNNQFCGDPEIIDAKGLFLCPGFIDAHTHVDSMYPFYEFVPYSIRGGTTTVITECANIANASGFKGIESYIKSTKGYPLRCFFVAPPLTPPLPEMEESVGITLDEFKKILKRKDFLGIGEAYWISVVDGDERVLEQAAWAISLNKALDGHSSGAKGQRLNEYLITGITSCHESVNANEAVEKIKNGVYVMIREGWVRRELKELSRLADMDIDKRRLILVSDVFDAVMLCEEGYMDAVVKKAIECGFSFFDAIKMATINPADYHRLRFLGAIAPLRYADIIFLKDLKQLSIEKVMVNGEIVFAENKFLKTLKPYNYPEALKHTITIGDYKPEDFLIKAEIGEHRIRVIEISTQTITKEVVTKLVSKNGFLEKDLENDIIPIAVINKTKPYQFGKGFIKGTGIKNGAIATTIIWDTCNILVIGSDEKDMAEAVKTLKRIQGGAVIVKNGEVIYEFPMPVFGTIPLNSIEEVRDKTLEFSAKLKVIGSNFERPFLTIQTIPFTGLPFLRITDKGIVDIKSKKLVSIFL